MESDLQGNVGNEQDFQSMSLINGNHLISLTVIDQYGATASQQFNLQVNGPTPPQLTLKSPVATRPFAPSEQIRFRVSVTDDLDSPFDPANVTWTSNVDGLFATGLDFVSEGLSIGTHEITVIATDQDGMSDEESFTISIEDAAGYVNIRTTSPLVVNEFIPFRLEGFGFDPDDGFFPDENLSWTSDLDGFLGNGQFVELPTASPGNHIVTLEGVDFTGATLTTSMTLEVIKNEPPSIEITSPLSGQIFTNGDFINFSANVTDENWGVKSVTWSDQNNTFERSIKDFGSNNLLPVGDHILTLTAEDFRGAIASKQVAITILNNPPEITLQSSAKNRYEFGELFEIATEVSDFEDGKLTGLNLQWMFVDGGIAGYDTLYQSRELAAGNYQIFLIATDSNGASTYSDTVSITVDTEKLPPTIDILSPVTFSTFDDQESITLHAQAQNQFGNPLPGVEWSSNIDGNIFNQGLFNTSNLSVGTHELTASITDVNGFSANKTVSITVYPSALRVNITKPFSGSKYSDGETVELVGSALSLGNPAFEIQSFEWLSDIDGVIGATSSIETETLSIGMHQIMLIVTDQFGARGEASIEIEIESLSE